jgi:hypothetical protein
MWRAFKIKEPNHTVEEARPVSTRFGARTVRVVSVRGNERLCTPDLVKSAARLGNATSERLPNYHPYRCCVVRWSSGRSVLLLRTW